MRIAPMDLLVTLISASVVIFVIIEVVQKFLIA
jgi:hypothetical protein